MAVVRVTARKTPMVGLVGVKETAKREILLEDRKDTQLDAGHQEIRDRANESRESNEGLIVMHPSRPYHVNINEEIKAVDKRETHNKDVHPCKF